MRHFAVTNFNRLTALTFNFQFYCSDHILTDIINEMIFRIFTHEFTDKVFYNFCSITLLSG